MYIRLNGGGFVYIQPMSITGKENFDVAIQEILEHLPDMFYFKY